LSEDFPDRVKIKWEGNSSGKMVGTVEINKKAIKDKLFIEWLENRELYNLWEREELIRRKKE
jgi:hypothetical protein